MSNTLQPRRARASYPMDFKLYLVEKSYQPGACVARLARDNGINDNLLFTWRQRSRHLLPDEIQRSIREQDSVITVVRKRAARTVLTGMCYSVGSATRQGSSSLTRFIGQSAMTSRT